MMRGITTLLAITLAIGTATAGTRTTGTISTIREVAAVERPTFSRNVSREFNLDRSRVIDRIRTVQEVPTQIVTYEDQVRSRIVTKLVPTEVEEQYTVRVPIVQEMQAVQQAPCTACVQEVQTIDQGLPFSRNVTRSLNIDRGGDRPKILGLIKRILSRRRTSQGKLSYNRVSPAGPGKEGVAFHTSSQSWASRNPCYATHPGGTTVTVQGRDGYYATRRFGPDAYSQALAVSQRRAQLGVRGHL